MPPSTTHSEIVYVLLSRRLRDRLKLRAAGEQRTMRDLLEEIVDAATRDVAPALAGSRGSRRGKAGRAS